MYNNSIDAMLDGLASHVDVLEAMACIPLRFFDQTIHTCVSLQVFRPSLSWYSDMLNIDLV